MNKSLRDYRRKGKRLVADGCAVGDTSGRTKQINEKSVFGLAANNFGFTVLIYSAEKQKIFNKLKARHGEKRSFALIHSVKLFYAIKDYIDTCPAFYICCEGFDKGLLKHYLKLFLSFKYHDKKINFLPSLKALFGKKNPGHILAWSVNKRGKRPTMVLGEKHFKKLNLF